jgi:hypothetical protein
MEFRMIKSPSEGAKEILMRRIATGINTKLDCFDAVGLVQGRMIDMIFAADIAEKAVGVSVADVRGSCPQNMILIAIFGDTSSVEAAMHEIKRKSEEGINL